LLVARIGDNDVDAAEFLGGGGERAINLATLETSA
jgi:hypothetical protein